MATKKPMKVTGSSQTKFGSDSTKVTDVISVYGNGNSVKAQTGNDQITVYKGKNHKIYGDAGKDTITVTKNAKTGIKVYGGSGNDTIKIQGGSKVYAYGNAGNDKISVSGGNNHVLTGGTGSDTYTFSAAIVKATSLTVNQGGAATGDKDILKLTKTNKNDVSFSYNSSKKVLTATHKTGGKIMVKNWATHPLEEVQFANKESVHVIAGKTGKTLKGTGADDYILAVSTNKTVNAGAGNDTVIVSGGSGSTVNGGSGSDTIRIKSGSGFEINSGTGSDKVYVDGGSVKHIVNSGGTDFIEIGKNAGNGIKVESVGEGSVGYKLVAKETVKVLGGNNHDIRLYGGDDKVIVAGGSGHVIYTDGPTGAGDAGGDDIIVIQDGGKAKKIVAGNGNDIIAVANGADNGSVIYTGLEDKNVTGIGHNTVNLLGGSGHTVYLNGNKNTVLIESQDVTLNKHHGTVDDITVRWSEEGTGTLRINCPSPEMGNGGKNSTLRIEGADSNDFSFEFADIKVTNGSDNSWTGQTSLVIKFTGSYERDTRNVNQVADTPGTVYYQVPSRNEPNNTEYSRLPVYVNTNGQVLYNWCQGNERFVYDDTPVVTAEEMTTTMGGTPTIEIARWKTYQAFGGITFDNGTFTFDQVTTAANNHNVLL